MGVTCVRLQGGRGGHRAFGRHGCPASRGGEGTAALPDTFRHAGRRLLRPDRVPRRHEPASVPRSPRYSEDLDFAGGTGFGVDDLRGLGECVRSSLAGMSPDVQVKVREPVRDEGLVRRWRISIRTAAQRRDLPSQSIKLEVASVPAHEPQTRPVRSIIPPCRRSPGTSSWRWKAPPRYSRTSFCRLHAPPISAVVTCGTCAGCRPGPTWMRPGRSGWPRSRLGNTGRSENGRRAQAGCVRSRRCCLRTPFWTRCEGSCRPECSSPPSNPSPGASTPRRRSPGCMIPPGPHGVAVWLAGFRAADA